MEDKKVKTKPVRSIHRPITIIIETVKPLPTVRSLPKEVQLYINLKGDAKTGKELIAEIEKQIAIDNFFAIEVSGTS